MDPNSGINLVQRQQQEFKDLLGQQRSTADQYFGEYKGAIGGQQRLQDVLEQAQKQRGVGELQNAINLFQNQISGTKGLLDRLPENLNQRTQGTFTTQALLDRQNAVEGGALRTQLSRLAAGLEPVTQAYSLASQDIGQLLGATQAQQQKELSPYEKRLESMGDQFSREITGFTFNKENELNVLMDKLKRERELNDREWQRAQQLAQQEKQFAYQKYLTQQAAAQQAASAQPAAVPVQTYTNKSGQITGYDTPYRSGQTEAGWQDQANQDFWSNLGRTTQNAVTGIGSLWNKLNGIGW